MSKSDDKIDTVLDFRHDSGVNWYLIKDKRTEEIKWMKESDLPKDTDKSLVSVRLRKSEQARRRVFGIDSLSTTRKVQLNSDNTQAADIGSDSSSSESDDGSVEQDDTSTTVNKNKDVCGVEHAKGILGTKRSNEVSNIAFDLVSRVGCRQLRLDTESDARLNSLFVQLLYSEGVVSHWYRTVLDLVWTLIITTGSSTTRDSALEQLCLLVSRLNDHDTIVSKCIDELLDETLIDELDTDKFSVVLRLIELVTRSSALDPGSHEVLDSTMKELAPSSVNTKQGNRYAVNRFSYVNPGEVELTDEGIVQLVYKIYEMKNKDKLGDVAGIIEKYKSQLSVLFTTLLRKYSVSYADLNDPRVYIPVDVKGQKLKERLSDIFTKNEPSRLIDVDEIVSRFIEKSSDEVAEYIEALERSYALSFGRVTDRAHAPNSHRINTSSSLFGFRELIEEAIAVGNPERLARVNQLLRKYSGREHFLYLAICDKYSLSIDEDRFKAAMALREKSVEMDRKSRMKHVLTGVYEKYNKAKLAEVDKLVEKFNVLELFDLVSKKYGIGLAEKVQLLLSTGVHTEVDVEFSPLVVETLHALALAFELDRTNASLLLSHEPTLTKYIGYLKNPLTNLDISSAELIIQAKSGLFLAHGPSGSIAGGSQMESVLRDMIEGKVGDVLRSLPVSSVVAQVTAQEPEYVMPDSFTCTETGRVSCVVSIKGDSDDLAAVVVGVIGKMTSFDVRQPTGAGVVEPIHDDDGIVAGPGAFRCFSLLRSKTTNATVFSGEYRSLQSPNDCLSLFRSRLGVVAVSDELEVVNRLMLDPKRFEKCTVIIQNGFAIVIGSHKHRVAFTKALEFLKKFSEQRAFKLNVKKRLCPGGKPGMILPPQINDWSDVTYHESGDDQFFENEEANETVRPLKLTRQTMRDSYLQGQLCLNCDETTHKPPECPIKRKVCWNCHGAHAGASCVLPCRFCKGRHSWGILECVKRGAKRYVDWLKSRSCAEEKGLGAMVDDVIGRLRTNGWNVNDSAVSGTIKSLTQMGVFIELFIEMAKLEDADSPTDTNMLVETASGGVKPVPPSAPAPALPDSQYGWTERVWLDEILSCELIGRDPVKLILTTKGSAIRKLEVDENCKISFKGTSARDIFETAVSDPAIDVRLHAVVMTDSPLQALQVKKVLRELIQDVETQVGEGSLQKPPVVEGFAFLEKIQSLNDNIAQFDFMNANNGAPIEIELKNHFEYIGDLRHWLHQKGVEVELGNEDSVKLPSSGKIIETLDAANRPNVDAKYIDIFNGFFELVSFWTNAPPSFGGQYWFEPYELRPAGLLGLADSGYDHAQFESGQVVHLSEKGASHFSRLLVQSGFVRGVEEIDVNQVLIALKGVVRASARDNRLLMYLKHPWSLSSSTGTVARDVAEDFGSVEAAFGSVLNPNQLRACGRLGNSGNASIVDPDPEIIRTMLAPYNDESSENQLDLSSLVAGDGLLKRLSLESSVPEGELPYMGYIVDWITPQEVTDYVSGFTAIPMDMQMEDEPEQLPPVPEEVIEQPTVVVAPAPVGEDLNSLTVNELRERLKARDLPTTGRKADLIERIKADEAASGADNVPSQTLMCRVELPRSLMTWSELSNNLSGPGNSHFAHIKQLCPTADISCVGTPAAALVGEARLHVQLIATSNDDYIKARSLVEDLVRAVVEVGFEICSADDSSAAKEAVMREVRLVEGLKK